MSMTQDEINTLQGEKLRIYPTKSSKSRRVMCCWMVCVEL